MAPAADGAPTLPQLEHGAVLPVPALPWGLVLFPRDTPAGELPEAAAAGPGVSCGPAPEHAHPAVPAPASGEGIAAGREQQPPPSGPGRDLRPPPPPAAWRQVREAFGFQPCTKHQPLCLPGRGVQAVTAGLAAAPASLHVGLNCWQHTEVGLKARAEPCFCVSLGLAAGMNRLPLCPRSTGAVPGSPLELLFLLGSSVPTAQS